ncbi:hypothetical protein JX265_011888 [Neoarthrinium moseri]|uniref:Uncharacterized protein n=1 Tax=Neoarthrinium moseri TaxID=1658444 RepID=A0A9P9WBP1_9PEZI|nr:hypothetical protein JX265_011888 [Neoarthrinium moseri]
MIQRANQTQQQAKLVESTDEVVQSHLRSINPAVKAQRSRDAEKKTSEEVPQHGIHGYMDNTPLNAMLSALQEHENNLRYLMHLQTQAWAEAAAQHEETGAPKMTQASSQSYQGVGLHQQRPHHSNKPLNAFAKSFEPGKGFIPTSMTQTSPELQPTESLSRPKLHDVGQPTNTSPPTKQGSSSYASHAESRGAPEAQNKNENQQPEKLSVPADRVGPSDPVPETMTEDDSLTTTGKPSVLQSSDAEFHSLKMAGEEVSKEKFNTGPALPPVILVSTSDETLKIWPNAPATIVTYTDSSRDTQTITNTAETAKPLVSTTASSYEKPASSKRPLVVPAATGSQTDALGTADPMPAKDVEQTESDISQLVSPEERVNIVRLMCQAISDKIPQRFGTIGSADSHPTLRDEIAARLYAFSKHLRESSDDWEEIQSLRIIRNLRWAIASRCQDLVLNQDHSKATTQARPTITTFKSLPDPSKDDIVERYLSTIAPFFTAEVEEDEVPHDEVPSNVTVETASPAYSDTEISLLTSSEASGEAEVDIDDRNIRGINPRRILDRFSVEPAFEALTSEIGHLIERYDSDKMSSIRRRVAVAVQRRRQRHGSLPEEVADCYSATFHVEWNLKHYLERNYDAGTSQILDRMTAVVGSLSEAQFCTVGQYFEQTWPDSPQELLRAVQMSLETGDRAPRKTSKHRPVRVFAADIDAAVFAESSDMSLPFQIAADLRHNTVHVFGHTEIIITVAQQVAWLNAVWCEKGNRIQYAYTAVAEVSGIANDDILDFAVTTKLEDPPADETKSCWNGVVGPAVVITGYPTQKRQPSQRGLEIDPTIMAQLLGIQYAVTLGGGFVLKGRYHACVPVKRLEDSVQWHVIDTYPKRLRWQDIEDQCPVRVMHENEEEELWNSRGFFGWCASVVCLLAAEGLPTNYFSYSNAAKPSKLPAVQLKKITAGVSRFGIATVEAELSRRDGIVHNQRADTYDDILDDAHGLPIIIYGVQDRRGYQTDAEEIILDVLARQQSKGEPLQTSSHQLQYPDRSRRTRTVRQAMLANADKITRRPFKTDRPGKENVLFKQDAIKLYHLLDALQENLYFKDGSSLELNLPHSPEASGWEYMDVLTFASKCFQRRVKLRKTCGDWHKYAKGIRAVPLFVENAGDLISPEVPKEMCRTYQRLPPGNSYIAVRSEALSDLFRRQGGLQDQDRLTDSGCTLFGPKDVFGPCPRAHRRRKQNYQCPCRRIQMVVGSRFVKFWKWRAKSHLIGSPMAAKELNHGGALIFGSDAVLIEMWNQAGHIKPDWDLINVTAKDTSSAGMSTRSQESYCSTGPAQSSPCHEDDPDSDIDTNPQEVAQPSILPSIVTSSETSPPSVRRDFYKQSLGNISLPL